MADVFDKRKRSWVMSRVKGKDTKPEIFVRSLLHRLGYRFTINGPKNRNLPGRPDIVLPKYGTVIFVHGCFWHGHKGCKHHRIPKSRTEWWSAKIDSNRIRDESNVAKLNEMGWIVIVLWTCQFDTIPKRNELAQTLSSMIGGVGEKAERLLVAEESSPYGGTANSRPDFPIVKVDKSTKVARAAGRYGSGRGDLSVNRKQHIKQKLRAKTHRS